MVANAANVLLKEAFDALNLPFDLKDAPSRSVEDWQTIYAAAFGHYETGSFEEASQLFTQLILADPYTEKHWRGLAASLQMEKKYEESLHAWAICALLAENDPLVHFHAAECLLSMKNKKEALKALDVATERLGKEESANALRDKIELLKKLHV